MDVVAHLRAAARRVRALEPALAAASSELEAGARVEWSSVAADRFRADLRGRAAELAGLAGHVADAAAALDAHAAAVERGPFAPPSRWWPPVPGGAW